MVVVPDLNEGGWKDTIRANPGQITRILLRFAPQDVKPREAKPGRNLFPFDPSFGPGYIWHCHILDHEDNEMMRPYKVRTCPYKGSPLDDDASQGLDEFNLDEFDLDTSEPLDEIDLIIKDFEDDE